MLIAAGIGAGVLPLLIHFLTRPRPRRLAFSAVRFVMQAIQQRRARNRLRDVIILALRIAAVVLLGAAMSRPLTGARALVDVNESFDATRLVLLDTSQSMGAVWHGVAAFERGRAAAAKYLSGGPSVRGNLIVAGARANAVFDRPSANFAALRQELDRAAVKPERLDVEAAIRLAGRMLAPAGPEDAQRKRELVIVSDFQRSNWVSVDFSALPADTKVELESAAPQQTPPNLAVVRAAARGRAEQGRATFVDVDVANFSPTARQVQVELNIGSALYHLNGLCPAGATTTLSAQAAFGEPGYMVGEARLIGAADALAADDVRPLVVHVLPSPTYALITRQSASERPSSSFYLERALAPVENPKGVRVVRIDPEKLDQEVLSPADWVVLDHPGRLSAQTINLLAATLRRGRPVLYVAAESADATNLKMLASAAGADLKMPVEFIPPSTGQKRRDQFLQEVNARVSPFDVFGDSLEGIKKDLRFTGGLLSRRLPGALDEDVLASYSDRSAALVVTPCGAGQLAVLNVDLEASNLPTSAAFVPLIDELAGRLASRTQAASSVVSGESFTLELPPSAGTAAGLQVVTGTTGADLGQITDQSSGAFWTCKTGLPPGVYRVVRNHATVFAVASALSPDEADLTPLDPELMRTRLAGGRQIQFIDSGHEQETKDVWWVYLAAGCVGCLLVELAALKFFRT